MAILIAIFNPACSKRLIMNYWYTRKIYELQKLPVYTIELVYEGRTCEIEDAYHVTGKSFMFHKENLYRILETKIPKFYKKLAFLDSDLLFKNPEWYQKSSEMLETCDVVQPFNIAQWLDLTYTEILVDRHASALQPKYDSNNHPGFAWCMTRKFYNEVGFFDYGFSGSGDTMSYIAWTKSDNFYECPSVPKASRKKFLEFCQLKSPTIKMLSMSIVNHLFHGSRLERKYVDRHKMLEEGDLNDMIFKNKDGVYEWKNKTKNGEFFAYFAGRKDDDIM